MSTAELDLTINQGETFSKAINWYGGGKVCKAIEDLTPGCPTQITITGHGLPSVSDTPVFIKHVKGARSANTDPDPAIATYIDADTFWADVDTFGEPYDANTGVVTYFAPKDLSGWTARMHIREEVDSTTTIHEMTSVGGDISISTNDAKITMTISATDTAAFDFDQAVYDLELLDGSSNVTRLIEGKIELIKEVTR
jgi:hypothetical protein